jgi:hypothetical protein
VYFERQRKEIKVRLRIKIRQVGENKYEARVEGYPELQGTGSTIFEAAGNLIFRNTSIFGIFFDLSEA